MYVFGVEEIVFEWVVCNMLCVVVFFFVGVGLDFELLWLFYSFVSVLYGVVSIVVYWW